MAAGNAIYGITSIIAGNSYDVRPPAGQEWDIHNLYYDTASYKMTFNITDGTTVISFDSDVTAGARLGLITHVTNAQWLRVINTSAGTTMSFAYDGIQTV